MKLDNPTPRDKRILEAHRRRYQQDQNYEEIAEAMGKSYDTIRDYFREESTERIKQLYDEDELEFMRLQLLNEIENSTTNAKSHLSRALEHPEVRASDLKGASKEEQKIIQRKINMLQELGVVPKPKDRKEVTKTEDTQDVRKELAEIYNKKQEAEDDES